MKRDKRLNNTHQVNIEWPSLLPPEGYTIWFNGDTGRYYWKHWRGERGLDLLQPHNAIINAIQHKRIVDKNRGY